MAGESGYLSALVKETDCIVESTPGLTDSDLIALNNPSQVERSNGKRSEKSIQTGMF